MEFTKITLYLIWGMLALAMVRLNSLNIFMNSVFFMHRLLAIGLIWIIGLIIICKFPEEDLW